MSLQRFFQYRLRTLMLLVAAIAVVLTWWLRPYDVEQESSDAEGDFVSRYHVRRNLLGSQEAYGQQLRRYADGREMRWAQWSGVPDPKDGVRKRVDYVLVDGSIVPESDWRLPDFESLIELIRYTIYPSSGCLVGESVESSE